MLAGIIEHINDHPWPGCQIELGGMRVTLMSSAIAMMILSAALIMILVLPLIRRWKDKPSGGQNVLEAVVFFVRDRIAVPSLHGRAQAFLPYLLTLFLFVMTMNLLGIIPLKSISQLVGLGHYPIGGAATGILMVCAGLAINSTVVMLVFSFKSAVVGFHHHHKSWPMWLCLVLSPFLWIKSFCPPLTGAMGIVLGPMLTFIEFVGFFSKCFALMIRLFANMIAGHTLIATMLMFIGMAIQSFVASGALHILYIGPLCILMSLLESVLDLLIAGLQAYIFTFLTAMFIGMAADPQH